MAILCVSAVRAKRACVRLFGHFQNIKMILIKLFFLLIVNQTAFFLSSVHQRFYKYIIVRIKKLCACHLFCLSTYDYILVHSIIQSMDLDTIV